MVLLRGRAVDAVSGIPIRHAWCLDEHGIVAETTWREVGSAYFGVVVPTADVAHAVLERDQFAMHLTYDEAVRIDAAFKVGSISGSKEGPP